MSTESSYETNSQLIDCDLLKSGVYQSPSYSTSPSCSKNQKNCDNQTYSSYATNSVYQGYYDNCLSAKPHVTPQCDLTYVNSTPKLNADCWTKCCNKNMDDCSQDCQIACVVNGSGSNKQHQANKK